MGSLLYAEEVKPTPITYQVQIDIKYNQLTPKEVSKLIPYLVERFKDACKVEIKTTRNGDEDRAFIIEGDDGQSLMVY
jgi:hypothetical protein